MVLRWAAGNGIDGARFGPTKKGKPYAPLAEILNRSAMMTDQQRRVLVSLHLRGTMGKMGVMKPAQRAAFLLDLCAAGYLTPQGTVTRKAIEEITADEARRIEDI